MANFVINTATAGDNTIGMGQVSRKLGLTSLALTSVGAQTITFKSETSGSESTSLSGPMALSAGVPLVLSYSPPAGDGQRAQPYLETLAGDNLIITLAMGVQVSGFGTYASTNV
jgi:hypothetical protein